MVIDISTLPTHLAAVGNRLNVTGPENSADTFLVASYLAESAIKSIAVVFHAALRETAVEHAYRFGYSLVRADGLGTWERAIYESTNLPLSALIPTEFQSMLAWITKRRTKPEDEWFQLAKVQANTVLRELGVEEESEARQNNVKGLITSLVQIRNKTKAHGAVGEDFFAAANPYYISAVLALVQNCPAFSWRWMHLGIRTKGNVRGILLRGNSPQHMRDHEAAFYRPDVGGVHFLPDQSPRAYACADLLLSNRECTEFFLPNGGYNSHGKADFIDYSSGDVKREDISAYLNPPVPLPRSDTHGLESLDVQANVFGNLPDLPLGYVRRRTLEKELEDCLLSTPHRVIVLHGPGGVGKTYLALNVAHKIAAECAERFEYIIWFSARDIDLRPTGPVPVRPAVADLAMISRSYGRLFGVDQSPESFSKTLQSPAPHSQKGILFIFDNFETLSSMAELHKFLETYTYLPNKVLITSRERAFKGDYPIEVRGMEFAEANQMMRAVANELSINPLLNDGIISSVYRYTQGHAYVIRVILGEIAKERKYVPPLQLMVGRPDIVNAVFERSFNKLSDPGRWVFLTVSNWKSMVSKLALVVTLGQRGLDSEEGIEECERLSMVTLHEMADGNSCYSSPQLARIFGSKKLEGDPDRLLIKEDLETLRKFGVIGLQESGRHTQERLINQFIASCVSEAETADHGSLARLDRLLEAVSNMWPKGWLDLAAFRRKYLRDRKGIEYALRRAVEEMPFSKEAWLVRARHAQSVGDNATLIASFVSAVEADPSDIDLMREAALHLVRYVSDHISEIPTTRRGTYLASVREHMVRAADSLDATGLSRLAWLFLLEGDTQKAHHYASVGASKDPHNEHCLKILERQEMPRSRYNAGRSRGLP